MALTYAAGTNSPSNLWQVVQDYVQNPEVTFVSYIPTFVRLAEERIYNAVQIPSSRKSQTGTLTAGSPYLALPTDWLATYALSVFVTDSSSNTYQHFLLNKDVEYIRAAFPYPSPTQYYGTPTHYGQFDTSTYILGPTPDQAYAVELHYYYYPASIVDAGSSWLGTNAENALVRYPARSVLVHERRAGHGDILRTEVSGRY